MAQFRTLMLQTYVPNMLGLAGGLTLRLASLVFAADPDARAAVRTALAGRADDALLQWIDG